MQTGDFSFELVLLLYSSDANVVFSTGSYVSSLISTLVGLPGAMIAQSDGTPSFSGTAVMF